MILFSFYVVSNTGVAYKQSPVLRVTLKAYIYIYIYIYRVSIKEIDTFNAVLKRNY